GPEQYVIKGTAGGLDAYCYVSMIEYNYLRNYSFEEDVNKTPVPSGWIVNDFGKSDELWCESKQTDSLSGENHFHFWSAGKNSVEFSLEQDVKDLKEGSYKFSISIMGGDAGKTDVYAYVKINDEIIAKAPMNITVYNSWDTGMIDRFEYDGVSDLKVGIYVKCEGDGNGAWGKIDDALLNSVGG
ncbi:MAG: hypothetical protein IIW22_06965, partial [Erysipelotrichaceae bacterium]|nr:hypothetical protein [Erysipelotrichaceae bacterium]